MLEAKGVGRRIGNRNILSNVNLKISAGEVLAVFGPNGAGKSTLFRVLSLLTRPSSGEVLIGGKAADALDENVRKDIGLLSHDLFLYGGLSALENLRFYAQLYDLPHPGLSASAALERVGLAAFGHDLVRTFSRGMQQRLGLARVLLPQPRLLFLDEPHTGLDQRGVDLLNQEIAHAAGQGSAVVLVTHELATGYQLCDRYLILAGGRIRSVGAKADKSWEDFQAEYLKILAEAK